MNRYKQRQEDYELLGELTYQKGVSGFLTRSDSGCCEKPALGSKDLIFLGPGIGSIEQKDLNRLISFHGYLTSGAFIGLQMLFLGKRLLNVREKERIHVQCETINCIPDSFQIIAGTTIGNKGLIIRNTGKLAATITRHTSPGESAPGVRLILDPKKTKNFPKLHAWYLNTQKVAHEVVIAILREAGENVYSYKFISAPVFAKEAKKVRICTACGEPFVEGNSCDRRCPECSK